MIEDENSDKNELISLKKEFEEFVYVVSHDMKNSMRAVSNITTWIKEDLGDNINEDVLNNFDLLKNRVVRLENMMNSLMEYSRVNRTEMDLYEVNFPKLIDQCIEMVGKEPNVKFHISCDLENVNNLTFGKKLQKVIFSLLDNAVRFHDKEKKNVFIEISENKTDYEIKISDDGLGIPEGVKDKIFSIFYTVNSKDDLFTTGAGLAISSKIIKMVGGEVSYSPRIEQGSTFKFNWPKTIILKN